MRVVKDELAAFHIKYPVSDETVLSWMHACGYMYEKRTKNYFCEGHEDDRNRDRQLYVWLVMAHVFLRIPDFHFQDPDRRKYKNNSIILG